LFIKTQEMESQTKYITGKTRAITKKAVTTKTDLIVGPEGNTKPKDSREGVNSPETKRGKKKDQLGKSETKPGRSSPKIRFIVRKRGGKVPRIEKE